MSDRPNLTALEKVLRRDRAVVATMLVLVTLLCWVYLVDMAIDMGAPATVLPDTSDTLPNMEGSATKTDASVEQGTLVAVSEGSESKSREGSSGKADAEGSAAKSGGGSTGIQSWTVDYFVMMFLMWAIMMVGMMVPSAAPMILIYAGLARKREQSAPYLSTSAFLGGYLFAWTVFSLAATILQWLLDEAALLSPMMVSNSPMFGAALLVAAGVFQLTPYKNACLAHCRSPFQFFMQHWRVGKLGAFRMGLHHGWYCLGCCWAIMGLLFFGGVMNLVWIAAITVFVLLEKVLPRGVLAGRISGLGMIATALVVGIVGWAG